jgi:hypothetical protein
VPGELPTADGYACCMAEQFSEQTALYFSTTRFREMFPDPLCGGGPLHVARPVI